jgi:serine/threonine protein kinase
MWALGVVLFTLVTGTTPWPVADPSDLKYAAYRANEAHYLAEVFHLSGAANDFFRWCFAPSPADRPTLDQMYDAVLDIGRFATARLSSLPTPTAMFPAPAPRVHLSPKFRFIDRRKQSITTRARFTNKLRRVY